MHFQLEEPDEGCLRPDKDVFCFQGGDARSNENMVTFSQKYDIVYMSICFYSCVADSKSCLQSIFCGDISETTNS